MCVVSVANNITFPSARLRRRQPVPFTRVTRVARPTGIASAMEYQERRLRSTGSIESRGTIVEEPIIRRNG